MLCHNCARSATKARDPRTDRGGSPYRAAPEASRRERGGSFDPVLCLYGLHHFRGYLDALREVARVLKPAGTFALIDPIRRPGKESGTHHGLEVPTHEELKRMLGEAGFETVRSRASGRSAKAVAQKKGSQG